MFCSTTIPMSLPNFETWGSVRFWQPSPHRCCKRSRLIELVSLHELGEVTGTRRFTRISQKERVKGSSSFSLSHVETAQVATARGIRDLGPVGPQKCPSIRTSMAALASGKLARCRRLRIYPSSVSALAIWHSLRELLSCPEVWLAQCLCKSNESLPYRKLVESAKTEEQRIRIRASQSASIDGENLNILGCGQHFRPS